MLSIDPEMTIYGAGMVFAVPERSPDARGPAPRALRSQEKPVSIKQFARSLTDEDFQTVSFRGKGKKRLRSRFAFQRVMPHTRSPAIIRHPARSG